MAVNKDKPFGRMKAGPKDPMVSVSTLSEYLFCKRAAIISNEQNLEFKEAPKPVRRLFFPIHRLNEIKPEIVRCLLIGGALLLGAIVSILLLPTLFKSDNDTLIFVGAILGAGVFFLLYFSGLFFHRLLQMLILYAQIVTTTYQEPDPDSQSQQKVNWFKLQQNGFQVVYPRDPLKDNNWKLIGSPWRILQREDLRIPIFIKSGDEEVRRQQMAQVVAYCHLLELTEPGAKSPYGIVLFGEAQDGLTVPNGPKTRKLFHDALVGARQLLSLSSNPSPPHKNCCYQCPHGWPKKSDGYKSACGVRFEWIAPHKRAFDLNLFGKLEAWKRKWKLR